MRAAIAQSKSFAYVGPTGWNCLPHSLHLELAYTPCLRKNCAKLFISELCQISINFNNFWQVYDKMAKFICYINIFHLTLFMSSQYLVKQKTAKCLHNA